MAATLPLSTAMGSMPREHIAQGGDPADQPGILARGLPACLPPARQLATALQAYWGRPAQQQTDQLELAKAAAARSCANLGCANLGGEGGPAAGEGADCKRCRCVGLVWR